MNHCQFSRQRIWTAKLAVTVLLVGLCVLAVSEGSTASARHAAGLIASEPIWRQSTTGLGSGYVKAVAISPHYGEDQTVLVGTFEELSGVGGVYRSSDAGETWHMSNQGLTTLYIGTIRFSPNFAADETIFTAGYLHGELFKSVDGGATWSSLTNGIPSNLPGIEDIAVSPDYANDQTAFIATEYFGIYKSTDGGASWSPASDGLPLPDPWVYSLAISPNYTVDGTLFAGVRDDKLIFKSTDRGQSWFEVYSDPSDLAIYDLQMSSGYAADQTIYASAYHALLKSTNGGQDWEVLSANVDYQTSIVLSPNYPTDLTVFAESGVFGGQLIKSTDGGASWIETGEGLPPNLGFTDLDISPDYTADGTLYVGVQGAWGWGGVFKSTDYGVTGFRVGLPQLRVTALARSATFEADQTVFAGVYEFGEPYKGVWKSHDAGLSWSQCFSRYKLVHDIAPSPEYLYDQTVFVAAETDGVRKSIDGGDTWQEANSGIEGLDIRAIETSPVFGSDGTLFVGTWGGGIYTSDNMGATWTESNTGLFNFDVQALAISPGYGGDRTIFAGTGGGGVFRSGDAGAHWTACNTGLGNRNVKVLICSPNFEVDQTLFAGTAGGVFRTTDACTSWQAINNGITDLEVQAIAISPGFAMNRTLYSGAATGGVFASFDRGEKWTAINEGLDDLSIHSLLALPDTGDQLLAGTGITSVWRAEVSAGGEKHWVYLPLVLHAGP